MEVVYVDGSSLKIREYLDAKYRIERVSYAYQYQDKNNVLIFRYDNAPHRPSLGFMEHKHTSSGDAVRAELPDADDLVDEILEYIKTV